MSGQIRFSHMGFYVSNISIMEKFYRDMLDFTVTDRGTLTRHGKTMQLVFLSKTPGQHHEIVLVTGRPAEIPFNPINQISLKADNLETLVRYHQRFSAEKWSGIDPISHGNAVSFYLPDPEGNRLEIYWDTPWYVSQPMVETIDLTLPTATLMADLEDKARRLPGFKTHANWRAEMAVRMGQD